MMRERTRLAGGIATIEALETEASDSAELIEMAEAEGDKALLEDVQAGLARTAARAARAELEALLSGEADANADLYKVLVN